MKTVQQHPDGSMIVRVDDVAYSDTPENFADDFGVTGWPPLPPGFNERIYDQGRRHLVQGAGDDGAYIHGEVMPWPLGDEIIAKIGAALAKQKAREAATKPAEQ